MISRKYVDKDNKEKVVQIQLLYNTGFSKLDSQTSQVSNICLQLNKISRLHCKLKKRKIQLESMLLEKFKQLDNIKYISRPISKDSVQQSFIQQCQQKQNDSVIEERKQAIVINKFSFIKGKMLLRDQYQKEISNKQSFFLQTTQIAMLYQFIRDICSAIVQLQGLEIYHADIKLRNIIYCQGRYKLIDFGEALCFNEEQQYLKLKEISEECVNIINDLKQRRQDVYLDYINKQKKDKFEQYSFEQYKNSYKEMHSQQFLQLFETFTTVKDRKLSVQKNMRQTIEKYIQNREYYKLIQLCNKRIEDLSTVRQDNISQKNLQRQSELSVSIENRKNILLNNQDNSQDEENIGSQRQKSAQNSQYTSQQSPLLLGFQESKISSDQLVLNSIKRYNQDKVDSYLELESLQKEEIAFEQQSEQLSCHHQTISKVCLSIKCIEKNNYLLCECQQGHINREENEIQQCRIVDIKEFSKLMESFKQKIKQWGSKKQYLKLLEAFQTNPLSKIEQYYRQIMSSTISQLSSLSKQVYANDQQILSSIIDRKDMAFKLNGLYRFSRFDSKIQFDQFIQFTVGSLEQSSSKIIQLVRKQLDSLKNTIEEAFNYNESTNIVKKYLNQKYRTVVDHLSYEDIPGYAQSNRKQNNSSCIPLNEIKKHHFAKIENLTLGSQTQEILDEQNQNHLLKKLQQSYSNSTRNNYWQVKSYSQENRKIRKYLYSELRKQSYLCKTLKYINQNNFNNLKSLEIDLIDSKSNNKYQFLIFDLFDLISKTSINHLKVKGVKVVQFQQFIRVFYEYKHDQSKRSCKAILDNNNYYTFIQKYNKSPLLKIQIDIQIRFIFKFKESIKKKKQQLFYFLDHIKQLKYITLTLQFNYQQVDQLSLQLIQELMQHPKIKGYRLNIHKLQIRQYDNTHILFRTLKKISQYSPKIIALQFQNVQFGQQEKLQTKRNTIIFKDMITKILSKDIKQYSVVNCNGFPMINIGKTSLNKLMIDNTTFKTKQIEQKQQKNICHTIQFLWIRNSGQLLQKDIHLINFEKLTFLNITLSDNIWEYLVDQKFPLLKTLIISRNKYLKAKNQLYRLSKLLHTIKGLEVFNVENILVGSQDIKSLKPSALRVLKLSHLNVQNKEILLSKEFNQITELSFSNITFEKYFSQIDLFYQTFDRMQNLRKLKIDKKIMDSQFDIQKLRKKGVFVTFNK